MKLFQNTFRALFCLIPLFLCSLGGYAQTGAAGLGTPQKKDTSLNKTNTNKWKNESARITYEKLNSAKLYTPDTGLHTFQRLAYLGTWYRDLGNIGSPALNLLFMPEERIGPTLGYHVYDAGGYNIDSLKYFNTSRPYSDFSYRLGSKLEQYVGLMHSQNIRPNWNFAVEYHKTTSAGYYKIERNNNDNVYFTSNYKSIDKHYTLYFGLVYNKEQHDENGGMTNVKEFDSVDKNGNKVYSDRRTLDVVNQNDAYSLSRSSVYNNIRVFSILVQHSYYWGLIDTAYNSDSTQYSYKLKPRFSLTHKMELSTQKHTYNDLTPDSLRYVSLFNRSFTNSGTGYYTAGEDSVIARQKWFYIDNKVLFNGFLGKSDNQAKFSAGIGTRYDRFISDTVSNLILDSLPKLVYAPGRDKTSMVHNYIESLIKKEALQPGEWAYSADAKLFITGIDAGNFQLHASIGKELTHNNGIFVAGFQQQVNSVPYSYTTYENVYIKDTFKISKNEILNMLYATLESPRLRFSGGVKNYVITNYIYVSDSGRPAQYTIPINIQQVWLRKVFKMGKIYLDNEIAYQQRNNNAPVNIPTFMARHQLSYENALFKKALKVAIGLEVRYNTAYKPARYDYLLNRFFYQNTTTVSNTPEISVFFNFRVKNRFRAFIMGDQLQQLIPGTTNTIPFVGLPVPNAAYPGTNYIPVYAMPNAMLRFGFSWVMIN